MTGHVSSRRRAWFVLAAIAAIALVGASFWIAFRPPWGAADDRAAAPASPGPAFTVNGEPVSHDVLAVATRRSETSYRETGRVSSSFFQGANGAFTRLVLRREAMVTLVRQTLVAAEAKARGIEIPAKKLDEETQSALTQLAQKAQSSGVDINALLLDVGQTLDEFTNELRAETRARLLGDEVMMAVVGRITPTEDELRALYEAKKATYGTDYEKAKDKVRSDFNRDEVARRRDQWMATQFAKADVRIADPILAAFDQVKKNDPKGLASLERLWSEKRIFDPYLPYYIARIHNDQAIAAFAERQDLETSAGKTPTAEQTTQIENVRRREKDSTTKAIAHYVATLKTAPADNDLLRRIVQLNPSAAVRALTTGLTSLAGGDVDAAVASLNEAVKLDEGLAVARLALGDAASQRDDRAAALAAYREAASRAAKDVDMRVAVGDACLAIGELGEAEREFAAARALAPDYVRLSIAEGDLALRRLYDAAAERDRLAALTVRTAADDARRGALEKTIADLYAAATKAYNKALAQSETEDVLVKVGNADLLVGKIDEATSVFRQVLRRSAQLPEAHVGLGDVLAQKGDEFRQTALAHYEAALARITDTAQQAGVLVRILKLDPTNGPTRVAYAIALTRLHRWNDAIEAFTQILNVQPDLVQAHLWVAESYSALGDYETAITHLKWGLGGTATPAAKDSACAQIVVTVRRQVTAGGTPSKGTLDTLIDVARNRLGSGYPGESVEALALVSAADVSYRQAEVVRLLEAAKTAPTKQDGTMD